MKLANSEKHIPYRSSNLTRILQVITRPGVQQCQAHVILVSAQVLLVLTLGPGLWTSDLGFTIMCP